MAIRGARQRRAIDNVEDIVMNIMRFLAVWLVAIVVAGCATGDVQHSKEQQASGAGYLVTGEWRKAEKYFDQALEEFYAKLNETNIAVFECAFVPTGCQVQWNAYREQHAKLEKVINGIKGYRAFARFKLQDYEAAFADAQAAHESYPKDTSMLFLMALSRKGMGDDAGAGRYSEKLRDSDDIWSVEFSDVLEELSGKMADAVQSSVVTEVITRYASAIVGAYAEQGVYTGAGVVRKEFQKEREGDVLYDLYLPEGWRLAEKAKHTKWISYLEYEPDRQTLGGIFRVYLLHPRFGYNRAVHNDYWDYLSEFGLNYLTQIETTPGFPGVLSVDLRPYDGLNLPPGWEARISGYILQDQGRTLWLARRDREFLYVYLITINPHSPNAPTNYEAYIQQYRPLLEQMVSMGRFGRW